MKLPAMPSPPPPHWRQPLALLVLVLAVLGWVFRGTFTSMVEIWSRSDTFAHAFLVLPISLWLVWRRRAWLAAMQPQPGAGWLLLAVPGALAWLVGDLAGVNALTQFAATGLLVLTVPVVLGTAVALQLLFPLVFLFFMVPFGEFVMPTLMQWTADVTVFSLKALGIPVFREGLQFVIPTGTWSVVEACSGVRYLIASFMVGTLFAYLNYQSPWRRVAFGVVSLLVPIAANWARAVMIVLLGHLTNNEVAAGADHLVYGWAFFGVVIGIMFFIGSRWADAPYEMPSPPASLAGAQPSVGAGFGGRALATVLAMVAVLAAPALVVWRLQSGPLPTVNLSSPALPSKVAAADLKDGYKPVFEGVRAETQQQFQHGDRVVTMHVAYYVRQTYGHKLVSSQNVLVSSKDEVWRVSDARRGLMRLPGLDVPALMAEVRRGQVGQAIGDSGTLQVRQVYWVGGRWVASGPKASLLAVWHQLVGQGDDAVALTFTMPGGDAAVVAPELERFLAQHLGTIGDWLAAAKQPR